MFKFISTAIFLFFTSVLYSQKNKNVVVTKLFSAAGKTATIYTTADSTSLRISLTEKLIFKEKLQPLEGEISVFIEPDKTYQTFMGIGAAITDASAEVFAKLSLPKQQELLQSYFNKDIGIGYTLARTNIHSCDFSSGMYTYVKEGDTALTSFDIKHDKQFRIPFIKQAIAAANGKLTLFASPWSPPAFMKTNKSMLNGGKLNPAFADSWARYYVKFIKAYENEGIPIWGISIQNEPMAIQRWESCIYTAEDERDFLKNHLGPTMNKEGLANKKIIVWDHNRDLMTQRATVIFNDAEAAKYAWGMGFHWYETWSGSQPMFENVGIVHATYPTKNLLFTEGCVESFKAEDYQNWTHGERYGKAMINDFNNGTVGWTDWNILLDENGGPNHVGNFCFAPVHANTVTGEIIYTPSYYYIGHFSKYVRPKAKRVNSASSRSQLITTAFLNEDGKLAVIVMNESDKKITYNLCIKKNAAIVTILPHAIQTLIL